MQKAEQDHRSCQRGKATGGDFRDDDEESERSVTAGILPPGAHRLDDHMQTTTVCSE